MASTLIPERPLLISPTLAATIGLEETVMLHVISELFLQHPLIIRNQRRWAELDYAILHKALPFWSLVDIKRIRQNLQEKGLVQIEAVAENTESFLIAINQVHQKENVIRENKSQVPRASASRATHTNGGATHIAPDWTPSEDFYQLCRQRNIPNYFADERIKEFVMGARERGKAEFSWNRVFFQIYS